METLKTLNSKSNFKNKTGSITHPDFKLLQIYSKSNQYDTSTKNRYIDQCKRIDSSEINPCLMVS